MTNETQAEFVPSPTFTDDDMTRRNDMFNTNYTIRSTIVGLLVGSLMCFSNMYFGLQTGWISMMSLQASLLGFAIFRPFHYLNPPFGAKENVYLQTVAVATATMPLAAGFVGIIPALTQLTEDDHPSGPVVLQAWKLMLWSLGLSFIGVFFAVPLRKQVIIKEKLKFPSGTATAQMIHVLHDKKEEHTLRRRRTDAGCSLEDQNLDFLEDERLELSILPPEQSSPFRFNDEVDDNPAYSVADEQAKKDEMWALKFNALGVSFMISSIYTLVSYFFPIISALPLFNWMTLNLLDFKAWEWYFTPSLSYVGQGIIMGLPTTLSMLLGCIIGWGILSPLAYYSGWAPGPISDWKTGSKGWILWISLGIMISESIVSLLIVFVKQLIALIRSHNITYDINENENSEQQQQLLINEDVSRDEGWDEDIDQPKDCIQDSSEEEQVRLFITIMGLILSVVLCVAMVQIVFENQVMSIGMTLVSILFALFLSVLGVRALGETDLNPVSGIGKISQVVFAYIMPGAILANLIAGGIAEAGAQQAGDLMQDLKTGYLIKASPKAQFYGQLIGSLISSFVATGAYLLYTTVYDIPGPQFPAPTAQVWLDMSRLVNGHPLPPHVSEFIILFSIIFAVLVLIKETGSTMNDDTSWRRLIPQGIAFAIGIYNPPNFTLARVIGGLLCSVWDSYCNVTSDKDGPLTWFMDRWCIPYRKIGKVFIIIVASGFVLGEGTFAIVNLILSACHVPHF